MFYEKELQFLHDVFEKCRVGTALVDKKEVFLKISSLDFEDVLGNSQIYIQWSEGFTDELADATVYKLRDSLGLCFLFFVLPEKKEKSVLLIGPYRNSEPTRMQLLELGEKNGISPNRQRYFEEYLLGIPMISEGDPRLLMLDRFCEIVWKSPAFSIVDVNEKMPIPASPINGMERDEKIDDVMVNLKAMEIRYAFENELIRAVTLGQLHKEKQLLSSFSEHAFEKRVPDAIRNAKNYSIIMNTLLRKAAENGGVHPMYIDRVSSEFALKIENISSVTKSGSLMVEMFRAYCRLVRKHTLQHLSPVVQKTVLIIDSDLSADLSPSLLAQKQNVSLGYLCTIFKKEMKKTISEYVREKRIRHACYLISTTNLQIQTVALHCGIVDVQYFSKIFKGQVGKTPKEYREHVQSERQERK